MSTGRGGDEEAFTVPFPATYFILHPAKFSIYFCGNCGGFLTKKLRKIKHTKISLALVFSSF